MIAVITRYSSDNKIIGKTLWDGPKDIDYRASCSENPKGYVALNVGRYYPEAEEKADTRTVIEIYKDSGFYEMLARFTITKDGIESEFEEA